MKSTGPQRVDIDRGQIRELVSQTDKRRLTAAERETLQATTETLFWLSDQLKQRSQRLYRMLFGPSSEKTSAVLGEQAEGGQPDSSTESDEATNSDDTPAGTSAERSKHDKRKGHGRRPANEYRGADKICISHESLEPGQRCPKCGKGKLYRQSTPAVLVRVTGQAPLGATVYECERLRCNLCGEVFTAPAPTDAGEHKYDESAAAMIALLRHGSGMPHYRLSKLQQSLGIPLPASTQWQVIDRAASELEPVFDELVRQAASALAKNDPGLLGKADPGWCPCDSSRFEIRATVEA